MGIEQGTPVAGSIIDLPHNLDLLDDLRLPRVFKAWMDFKTQHQEQISAIGTLQLGEVVSLAKQLSTSISQAIGIEANTNQEVISKAKMAQLVGAISGEGNRVIFMRHGEQSPPEWVFSILQPPLRKIRMMQNPYNTDDLLTNKTLVDVFLTAFGLLYIKETIGKEIRILSSENLRAKEVAEVISTIIPEATFSTQAGLTSITYRDEKDEPPISIEEILKEIPTGFMPWDPKLVDRLCKRTSSGLRQSELIINTVRDLVNNATKKDGSNNLQIVLTHTQQLAEVLRQRGKLEDPMIRFPELTMLALEESGAQILPWGILAEKGR